MLMFAQPLPRAILTDFILQTSTFLTRWNVLPLKFFRRNVNFLPSVFQLRSKYRSQSFSGMFCSFICGSSTAGRGYRSRCFFPVLFPRKSFSFQSDLFCPEGCIPGELPHEKCFVFHGFQDFHNPLGSIFSMFISDVSRPS